MTSNIRFKFLTFSIVLSFASTLFSADKYWTGAAGSNASLAGSWCDDAALTVVSTAAPADGDDIHLTSGSVAMTWDLDIYVNSWVQDGYTGTVTFKTGKLNGIAASTAGLNGYTEDDGETRILKVTDSVVINSGIWQIAQQLNFNTTRLKAAVAYTAGLGVQRLILDAGGSVTVGASATISAKGLGFRPSQGPGAGNGNYNSATHGGMGSWNTRSSSMNCYGIISAPVTQGSGGANASGGGAVTIISAGAMQLDGTIDVAGNNSTSYHVGAGGSIYINAASLSGAGTLNANGSLSSKSHDRSGGGGRIAVVLTGEGADFTGFTGTIKAKLGARSGNSCPEGAGGTIYLEEAADGARCGTLIIDGCEGGYTSGISDRSCATILDANNYDVTPKKIVLRPEARLQFDFEGALVLPEIVQETDENLSVRGFVRGTSRCVLVVGREMNLPIVLDLEGSQIDVTGGLLEIGSGQTLYVNHTSVINASVHVLSGGRIAHYPLPPTKMNLTINGDLTVDEGGEIYAVGYGSNSKGTVEDGGGAYGGRGANATRPCCYGSVRYPFEFGARGKGATGVSNGGGLIRITATGSMTINGAVNANGANAAYRCGSGGSIWLTADSISGAGSITANGGSRTGTKENYNPGGGGRVAIHLTGAGEDFSDFTGTISALGGKWKTGKYAGGAGTVYLKTGDQAADEGTCIVENGLRAAGCTDFMTGAMYQTEEGVTDLEFGELIVRNANLCISNTTVSVKRGLNATSEATITGLEGGVVAAVGTDDAYFYGLNTFYGFRCEVPDKTICFGTGDTNSFAVSEGGIFILKGAIGTNVVVRSAVPGENWRLQLPVSMLAECIVENVTAESSDASSGETVTALNSRELTEGSCTNWRFVDTSAGQENRWLGTKDSMWLEPSNWSLGRAPIGTDLIIIAASDNAPELSSAVEINSLEVAGGAKLKLCGYALTVVDSLVVHGTIECSDSERIESTATNIVFDADSLDPGRGTLVITGDGDQTVAINARLWNLAVEKSGGSVAWSGSCTAGRVMAFSASAATEVSFATGAVLAANEFRASGTVDGSAALTLSGTWSLDADGVALATGVRLGGCDASPGKKLYVYAPCEDLGENQNCYFGTDSDTKLFIWTGAGDSDFSNPANWQGRADEAPGPDDLAIIASAASITVASDIELGGLLIGGGEEAATLTMRGELDVADAIWIATNGVLCIDAPASAGYVQVDNGGRITHTARDSAGTYKINLAVAGDMLVSEGGSVDGNGKGYGSSAGPGCAVFGAAASHGGCGAYYNVSEKHRLGYGSFTNPVTYGSGGYSGGGTGGGVVLLDVTGTLVIDGTVAANAGKGSEIYTSSGGSVNIKCGIFEGIGSVTAHGSYNSSCDYTYLSGAGGRIAIEQRTGTDFSLFTGSAAAYGGRQYPTVLTHYVPYGNSGHVTWILPGSRPRIVVENNGYVCQNNFGVALPAVDGDSAKVMKTYDFELRDAGCIFLTDDVEIYDLSLATEDTTLYLNGHTLAIRSRIHKDRRGWLGTVDTGSGGQVIWVPSGMFLSIR